MQIILVQPDTIWKDREANFERVRVLVETVAPEPGALVVLPEMFSVGYTLDVDFAAEGERRPTERFLAQTARRFDACVLGGLVSRAPDGRGRNEALAVGPDGDVLARYVKIHPFSYVGEQERYEPGKEVVTFTWGGFTIAPFVCYDLRFPEVYRVAAAQGADVLVTIANWPAARAAHWRHLLVARAIENQAYSVGVNRAGKDPNASYPGGSMVVDPRGCIVAEVGDEETGMEASVEPPVVTEFRAQFPALADMRDDFLVRPLSA